MHGPIFEVPFSENGTPPWREAHLQVKMYKTPQRGTNFWRSDVQKWHTGLAHLQVKTIKTDGFGLLFEVPIWKNYALLWRELHSQVKMYKVPMFWNTFWHSDAEKLLS